MDFRFRRACNKSSQNEVGIPSPTEAYARATPVAFTTIQNNATMAGYFFASEALGLSTENPGA